MPASGPAADFDALLPWSIVTFTGNRILQLSDAFAYLISQDGAGQTVTIPPNFDVAFDAGTQISFKQGGTGVITFAPGAGVTIESRGSLVASNDQDAVASIVQDSADIWSLFGDLV
ncbi:hypothetical protein LCGC14_0639870 [marine sediment metagenome]|uniref:Uncharacterized protein n=1 Tax=marine sediment metagenome TaxID=412755 RepID=A0A0F9RIW0_9ZZZZ